MSPFLCANILQSTILRISQHNVFVYLFKLLCWIPDICPQVVTNTSGCGIESTEKIADCMKNLDIDTIVTIGQVRYCM